jgi:DNA-binding XRE family transcriptional regulator
MELTIDNASSELLKFRQEHGLTQEKLSEKSEVAKGTIISIEKGAKKPQATTIYKLNKYLSTFK